MGKHSTNQGRQLQLPHPSAGQIALKAIASPFITLLPQLQLNTFMCLKTIGVPEKDCFRNVNVCTWKHSSNQGRQFHLPHPSAERTTTKAISSPFCNSFSSCKDQPGPAASSATPIYRQITTLPRTQSAFVTPHPYCMKYSHRPNSHDSVAIHEFLEPHSSFMKFWSPTSLS